ncbi:polysaccharide pyruvyl transferase family protein [Nocardioides albus]|uniref:Polysaccharide pyruvyl transferase WcaK-like protein n=1 Tax=Nocardioides albus TaxID=1841 RepID=A0A7W5A5G1_9ACTN|nr:polysaccharide pyruvyl transferase family protein [Nocardioides albus]MBB3090076.1 polysaccharide pyruvyl transferase WcaK-like protein [Nocardioides albus]GGU27538.1 hypothetical protein GCM10007979_27840 [Nocardioides albus]
MPDSSRSTLRRNPVVRAAARRLPGPLKQQVKDALARRVRRGRKPVIGLAGFFGAGNYGDELFLSVYEQYFGDEFELRVLADNMTKPYYDRPLAEIVDEVDAILIGGGDILQPWQADPRYFNHKMLAKPVFVVGIGVPIYRNTQIKPGIIEKHKRFLEHPNVRFIGVRDQPTADWILANISADLDILVAPDMVCSLELPPAEKPEGAPILGVVTRFRPNLDEPDDYSRVEEMAGKAMADGWRVRHLILGTMDVGRRDMANADDLDIPGKEVVYTESLDELTRSIGECTAFASMKFHGSVVATMYGVPSIVMIPTNKNRNFMKRIGLGANVSDFAAADLAERFADRVVPATDDVAGLRTAADAHLRELRAEVKQALGL